MMNMIQQQMREMMKGVEVSVNRSVAEASNDMLQRVNTIMSQRDIELTLKVDKMINGAKGKDTSAPSAVTLNDGTTLHDYQEEADVSTLGSKHEGFTRSDYEEHGDDEDEYKYDSEKVQETVPELPLDKDESRVKRQEASHPDREVMVSIDDDDETHLTDYVQWLKRREKLYPFHDPHHERLYKPRHDLLTNRGRELEYSRFAFLTQWDKRLFGDIANRWFKRLLHDKGVAKATDDKPPRPVSIHLIRVPAMSYDPRDRLIRGSDEGDQDLPPNSHTLSDLPARLRVPPYEDAARIHMHSLQEEADTYVYKRRLAMIARGELAEDDAQAVDTSLSDSVSVASYDRHTCKRCDKEVYGLVQLCSEHQQEVEREKRDAEQRRREQAARQQHEKQPAVANNVVTPTLSAVQPAVDQGARYSIMVSPYGTPAPDRVKEEVPRPVMLPTQASAPAVEMPKLDPWPQQYVGFDRVKQEEEARAIHKRKEEYERQLLLSDQDKIEEASSVMGSIFTRAFTPEMRWTMRSNRLPHGTKMTAKDRMTAVHDMLNRRITFAGERLKAPAYLIELCTNILKFEFVPGEVYQTMRLTMTGQAASWLQSEWHRCGYLSQTVKPVQALLEAYMEKWMNYITCTQFRESLRSMSITSDSTSLKDLGDHNAKFNELLTGLQMCDRHVDMNDIKHMYFKSLPNRCKAFIGHTYVDAVSIDDIYKQAEIAIITMHSNRRPSQDGDMAEVIGVNALPNKTGPKKGGGNPNARPQAKTFDAAQAYAKLDRRDITCWHCGVKGHYAGLECPLIGQDQTRRGQAVWAESNKTRYNPRPYDKNYYIERSQKRLPDAASGSSASSSQSSGPASSKLPNGKRRKDNRRIAPAKDSSPATAPTVELDEEDDQSSQ